MDTLNALQGMGLELPSGTYLIGAIVFGLVGWVAWRRGRKAQRRTTLWLGVALMFYPYLVPGTVALYGVGAALCAALVWAHRAGQ